MSDKRNGSILRTVPRKSAILFRLNGGRLPGSFPGEGGEKAGEARISYSWAQRRRAVLARVDTLAFASYAAALAEELNARSLEQM